MKLKEVLIALVNDDQEKARLAFREAIVQKTRSLIESTKEWQSMDAEGMYDFAVDNLSDSDMRKLDDELRGLHVEDEEDHEEAEQIISQFLSKHLS